MRSEYWSWTPEMRDASLWLSHAGRLFASWGWAGQAHHLLLFRDLEDAVGKSDAVIVVLGVHDDREVYRMWADNAVDVIVVHYRAFVGIFGPVECGVRRQYRAGLAVETADRHWWVSNASGLTIVALAWRDVLGVLAAEADADVEAQAQADEPSP